MMSIKAILRRLFPNREHRLPPEKIRGDVIRCYDCNKLGYIAYYRNGTYTISQGWKTARVRFTSLYICDKCSEKRRQLFMG